MPWLLNTGRVEDVWQRGALGQVGLLEYVSGRDVFGGRGLKEKKVKDGQGGGADGILWEDCMSNPGE